MSTEMQKVEAVEALNGIAQWCREDCGNELGAREVEKIRDAVAELIKEADAACDWIDDVAIHAENEGELARRLRVALTRIGSAS